MAVPFFNATRQIESMDGKIESCLDRVLKSGKFVLGEEGKSFEDEFSKSVGMTYGIAVNSGTDAIKIALKALGIGQGDEVITVANTASPTISAIKETGATPVLVDIDQYFTIDVSKLEKAITSKTKAIIPVHIYGQACDMKSVMVIADKHAVKVIEDCAQSIGAEFDGEKTGSFGLISCFSFYPTKNLGALGDGGMIVTSDKTIADTCRMLRMYGMEKTYFSAIDGYNSRMDEFQAAILRAKLPYLETWNKRRQEIASRYSKEIKNGKITVPEIRDNTSHVFHLYVIRTGDRDSLKKHLEKNSIGFGVHYEFPIHTQPAFSALAHSDLKKSEQVAKEILSLPIFPELTDQEISEVISVLNSF